MGTDSDLQDMLLDGEMRIDFLEGENCDLREENKRLQEKIKELEAQIKSLDSSNDLLRESCSALIRKRPGEICEDMIVLIEDAKERGAREMAQVVCDECKRCQDTGESQAILMEELMGLWRARRDKWVKI